MITEPATMITDYILGIVSFLLGLRLISIGRDRNRRSVLCWGFAFIATAAAAFIGGTYHGFFNQFGHTAETILWKLTMISAGVMSITMLVGSLIATVRGSLLRWAIAIVVMKFLIFFTFVFRSDDFKIVVMDYITAMGVVSLLHLLRVIRAGARNELWIFWGVVVSLLGAVLQRLQIGFHHHFNHNDLYHVIQTIAMSTFLSARAH